MVIRHVNSLSARLILFLHFSFSGPSIIKTVITDLIGDLMHTYGGINNRCPVKPGMTQPESQAGHDVIGKIAQFYRNYTESAISQMVIFAKIYKLRL